LYVQATAEVLIQQNITLITSNIGISSILWVSFALLDPDLHSPMRIRIHNTAKSISIILVIDDFVNIKTR
jgi:hypothetical protein